MDAADLLGGARLAFAGFWLAIVLGACSPTPGEDAGLSCRGYCCSDDDCVGHEAGPNCVLQHSGEYACARNCDGDRHCVGNGRGASCLGFRLGDRSCGCQTGADCPDPERPYCGALDAGPAGSQCSECAMDAHCGAGEVCLMGSCV